MWIAGLEHKDERAIDFWSADLRGALALVVGNEAEGMRRLVRQTCAYLLRIPMRGHIESLNAPIARSMVLDEVFRQKQVAKLPYEKCSLQQLSHRIRVCQECNVKITHLARLDIFNPYGAFRGNRFLTRQI